MKRVFRNIIVFVSLTSAFFVACAEVDTPQYEVSPFLAMDRWMKSNRPDVPMIDSGLYYEIFERHADGDELFPQDSSAVDVLINGKALDGSLFLNSNKNMAIRLGKFRYTTNYVPFRYVIDKYAQYDFTNIGVNSVIKKMQVGDSAVVFLSSNNSYGSIDADKAQYSGFEGSIKYSDGMIGEFDIVLKKIDPKPLDTALYNTEQFAINTLKLSARDSIQRGLYVKRTDSIGGGEFFGEKDTTIQIKYTGYFLDGFVFDTNVDSVARARNIYNSSIAYEPLKVENGAEDNEEDDTPATGVTSVIKAWYYALRELKPGDKATLITIPEWGYGDLNRYSYAGTSLRPATPLIFDIEVIIPEE